MLLFSNIKKLYDGTGDDERALHANVDLVIQDGLVTSLTPHAEGGAERAREAAARGTVIDASNFVVTPGIIDCHGHITALGLSDADMERMESPAGILFIEKVLHTTLVDGGVTTMRDIGGATNRMKRLVDEDVLIGPRLKVAICMLSTTGGHADFRGPDRCHAQLSKLWPPIPGRPSNIVDGPWEARKRVREVAACGADLIKICASPGIASPSDHLEHREFTEEEMSAVCDEAAARGLRVAAHAHSINGIDLAIRNGVNDLQHISFMDEAQVERAFEAGCTVTPTSWVMEELTRAEGLSPFVMEKVKKAADVHRAAVQFAATGNLKILAGTDPVLPGMHGRNYMEIAALIRDGLSSLRAWHGATGLAAEELGQDDAGSLRAGQRADLLVASEDIIEDPTRIDATPLVEVIKDGLGYRKGLPGVPQHGFTETVARWVPRT